MKLKGLGDCQICDVPVSELGAYVKLALNKYAHANCYAQEWQEKGIEIGRQAVLQEQAAAREQEQRRADERERVASAARIARQRAEAEAQLAGVRLCVRCRAPITMPSTEHPNTCTPCWNSDAPTKAVASAAAPLEKLDKELEKLGGDNAKKKDKPDRFDLIDLD